MIKRILVSLGLLFAAWAAVQAADKQSGLAGEWATEYRTGMDCHLQTAFERRPKTLYEEAQVPTDKPPTGCEDSVAMALKLKIDKTKTKLTGNVTERLTGYKVSIEEGQIDGAKFQFKTNDEIKLNNKPIRIPRNYKGELVDATTLKLERSNDSGKPIDREADGTPKILVFTRSK